jgi:hypothetical protein
MKFSVCLLKSFLFIVAVAFSVLGNAQSILNKTIPSLEVNRQRLDNVLEIISNKGNFYFSYNSNIINKDSLVSLSANDRTVKQILDGLFQDHYEFKESGNYIIIRRAPIKLKIVTSKAITEDKIFVVSGYVLDEQTGEQIHNASIYEKKLLVSALTNEEGYFKMRLKSKSKTAALSVSKEFYEDTTVVIEPRYNQQVTITIVPIETSVGMITISPEDYFVPDSLKVRVMKDSSITEYTYVKVDSSKVEKTSLARFLLSSKQKIQTINLKKFFTERPFQLSLTPGLSTQGKLSPQVINNFSLNVLGGYNGGINGMEIGGLFNIDKKNVRYFQAGGLFNIVGGYMKGMQVGGINNTVLDTVAGFQAAGVNNTVKGKFSGMQVGGVYNHVGDSVKGFQVAGVGNFAKNKVSGARARLEMLAALLLLGQRDDLHARHDRVGDELGAVPAQAERQLPVLAEPAGGLAEHGLLGGVVADRGVDERAGLLRLAHVARLARPGHRRARQRPVLEDELVVAHRSARGRARPGSRSSGTGWRSAAHRLRRCGSARPARAGRCSRHSAPHPPA